MKINCICILASFLFCTAIVCSSLANDILQITNATSQLAHPRKYVVNDYDGDGKSDLAVYSESQGLVYIYSLTNGWICSGGQFGGPGFMPFPGDFNGDRYCDLGMYNYTSGAWYILINGTGQMFLSQMGGTGFIPAIADYDGDGTSDIGVYNVFSGKWYVYSLNKGIIYWDLAFGEPYPSPQYGQYLDHPSIPVVGDYDGDGKADLGLFVNKIGTTSWMAWLSITKTKQYVPASGFWLDESLSGDYNGTGVFTVQIAEDEDISPYGSTLSGDYHGNGKYENVYCGCTPDGTVSFTVDWPDSIDGYFNSQMSPITAVPTKYAKYVWGNQFGNLQAELDCVGVHYNSDHYSHKAMLSVCNHKTCVLEQVGGTDNLYDMHVGGVIGDQIWFEYRRDVNNPSRGIISPGNPIRIYDYSNGKKTGGYWEFYR